MPTGQPWQKTEREVSPPEDRDLMTVIATASNPRFSVSRVDVDRGGPTYTIDTLTDLHRQRPDAELFFITGADAASGASSGRRSEAVRSATGCTGEPVDGSGPEDPKGRGYPDPPAGAGPHGPAPVGPDRLGRWQAAG